MKVDKLNLTYEGLVPRIQKSFLSKDVDAMQPHIRAFVERAVTFTGAHGPYQTGTDAAAERPPASRARSTRAASSQGEIDD